MRKAKVYQKGMLAGFLEEIGQNRWHFSYVADYTGEPVSLTMPVGEASLEFDGFPPAFEGLLPEGIQLEALLRKHKIDQDDPFSQLMVVGADVVGSLTIEVAQNNDSDE